MTLLNKCCCCELRVGALILGWLGTIGAFLSLASNISNLTKINEITQQIIDMQTQKHDQEPLSDDAKNAIENGVRGFFIAHTALLLLSILVSILLIVGVMKRNKNFLLPWLIYNMLSIIVTGLVVLVVCVFLAVLAPAKVAVIVLFILGGAIALSLYFWLCVYSFYQEIKEDETGLKRLNETMLMAKPHYPNQPAHNQYSLYPSNA